MTRSAKTDTYEVGDFKIAGVKGTHLYGVFLKDSDEEFKELNTRYTDVKSAQTAINVYISEQGKPKKEPKVPKQREVSTKKEDKADG